MDPASWVDALVAPQGQELLERLSAEPLAPHTELQVITRLRGRYPAELVAAAVTQVKLRRRARAKFARADAMLFTPAGLEQASSDRMARHHAARFAAGGDPALLADLCTGIGGDLAGLAAGRTVVAVDRDPLHVRLARYNAGVNGVGVEDAVWPVCADVRDLRLSGVPAAFIDPARRAADRRLGGGASEPPLPWCLALAERVAAVGIKAAPALPAELVPHEWELEFVSEQRELKESLLWSPALATVPRRATVLLGDGAGTLTPVPGAEIAVRPPGGYLIDPDPAVTRAGLVEDLARALSAEGVKDGAGGPCWKIDARVAFLATDAERRTPFGRTLRVEASLPWSLKGLREQLRALGVGVVDVRKRGSAVDVDDLRRRLKLDGDRSATVVLTRVDDRPWAFVCSGVGAAGTAGAASEARDT